MEPRTYWNRYVDQHGGVGPTAARLGVPYSTIAGVSNGSRGVGRKLAARMAAADPLLDAGRLALIGPAPNREAACG